MLHPKRPFWVNRQSLWNKQNLCHWLLTVCGLSALCLRACEEWASSYDCKWLETTPLNISCCNIQSSYKYGQCYFKMIKVYNMPTDIRLCHSLWCFVFYSRWTVSLWLACNNVTEAHLGVIRDITGRIFTSALDPCTADQQQSPQSLKCLITMWKVIIIGLFEGKSHIALIKSYKRGNSLYKRG